MCVYTYICIHETDFLKMPLGPIIVEFFYVIVNVAVLIDAILVFGNVLKGHKINSLIFCLIVIIIIYFNTISLYFRQ